LRNVSFQVRAGEIVGVAGVQGNGQTELVEALTGLRTIRAGKFFIAGLEMTNADPRRITAVGQSCHVPEDRHAYGMVDAYSVAHNLVLNTYYQPPFARGLTLDEEAIQRYAEELVARFDVRTPSVMTLASNLSGGNQQKMVVAREFSRPIRLLIAAQPTRGIDVGSIEFIHQQIVAKRDQGAAVLVVSSELDEIMALSDRIAVMYKGAVVAIAPREQATREGLGLLMAGVYPEKDHNEPFRSNFRSTSSD
jgi:simple sugar transport system ATP-binding protein